MTPVTYWREALLAALEEAAPHIEMTDPEVDHAASVLAGAAETRAEVTGETEIGRGDDGGRAERKRALDSAISAAHREAEIRALQVGWPKRDPEYCAAVDRAHALEDARKLAGLDRP